jgi:hypothetical protein
MMLYIKSRGKMGYLNGKVSEHALDDPYDDKWEAKNSMVMS